MGAKSIAFPAMGAGVGGLRIRDVAREMARVAAESKWNGVEKIVFVAWGNDAYREMIKGVEEALGGGRECEEPI